MKKIIKVRNSKGKLIDKQVQYIPGRYIVAVLITILEVAAIIGIVVYCVLKIPYFWIAALATQMVVILSIISRADNPDYKIPWIFVIFMLPVIGYMLYFLFYSRRLSRKYIKRVKTVNGKVYKDDEKELKRINNNDILIHSQALALKNLSKSHVYQNTNVKYYPLGDYVLEDMINDLKAANDFIFIEFFIIETGYFWNSILEVLIEKANSGVDVRVVYDDIGCMTTLPGNYDKQLKKYKIKATPYSRLRGQANSEFNNRNHRKIMVIDGFVGYTGGVNIADEYINKVERFGHWKDVAIRLEGEAVIELTNLFLADYYLNMKKEEPVFGKFLRYKTVQNDGFVIPFGDGPRPLYENRVGKTVIMNMLNQAKRYMYMESPYLIIDNEMVQAIENAALRGVDVRIIVPHIPDKKMIFAMTRSYYKRLMDRGVKIYEYEPGFIHAKVYIADDEVAMVGTINLDYRSLVHHFENGVWMYKHEVIKDIKEDVLDTINKSIQIEKVKNNVFKRMIRTLVQVFSPLL